MFCLLALSALLVLSSALAVPMPPSFLFSPLAATTLGYVGEFEMKQMWQSFITWPCNSNETTLSGLSLAFKEGFRLSQELKVLPGDESSVLPKQRKMKVECD